MTLVAIDPGFAARGKGCAVAVYHYALDPRGAVLTQARFVRPETIAHADLDLCATRVVWECPQVDARTRVSVPHVVQLAAVGGTLAGFIAGASGAVIEAVAPSAWKGSAPKPVSHGRLWAVLSASERDVLGGDATGERIEAAKRAGALARWGREGAHYYGAWAGHNLLDAAAIGAWALGRLER